MGKKKRKTKAKKKISDLKRKLEQFETAKEIQVPIKKEVLKSPLETKEVESPLETKELSSPLEKIEITATPTYSLEYPHLKNDLKKSFLLTALFLGIIFILTIILNSGSIV